MPRAAYGFPNLTDDDWIFGGDAGGHQGQHRPGPPGGDARLGRTPGRPGCDRRHRPYPVTERPRGGRPAMPRPDRPTTRPTAWPATVPTAPAIPQLGAPNLANGIWLYGGKEDQIAHSIRAGRNGVMPAHEGQPERGQDSHPHCLRLRPEQIGSPGAAGAATRRAQGPGMVRLGNAKPRTTGKPATPELPLSPETVRPLGCGATHVRP